MPSDRQLLHWTDSTSIVEYLFYQISIFKGFYGQRRSF